MRSALRVALSGHPEDLSRHSLPPPRDALALTWAALRALALSLLLVCVARAETCLQPGHWGSPSTSPETLPPAEVMQRLRDKPVVLLGEEHDDAQHHAWQLHMIAALHAQRPGMVIGFEGFPRRVQPILDQWVGGTLSETEFLRQVEWDRIWGLDPKLYMPIFQFARMHRVPLLALNVERALVSRVGREGWAAIAPTEREGISDPAPPSLAYLEQLHPAYASHSRANTIAGLDDPAFRRFVDSMLLWDRAMAQALAGALAPAGNARFAVGIVGRGHAEHFHGIPHQLRALGVENAAVLLPWDIAEPCATPPAGIADAVFGMRRNAMDVPGQRLGVELAAAEFGNGARVHGIAPDSVASASGLRAGDVIVTVAGVDVTDVQTVIAAVRRQAPGTWLPLGVQREGAMIEIIARFPPAP